MTISAAVNNSTVNNTAAIFDVSANNGAITQTITATEMDRKNLIVSADTLSVPEYGTDTFNVHLAYAANLTVTMAPDRRRFVSTGIRCGKRDVQVVHNAYVYDRQFLHGRNGNHQGRQGRQSR